MELLLTAGNTISSGIEEDVPAFVNPQRNSIVASGVAEFNQPASHLNFVARKLFLHSFDNAHGLCGTSADSDG